MQVLRLIVKLYESVDNPDWVNICMCLMLLDDFFEVAKILHELLRGSEVILLPLHVPVLHSFAQLAGCPWEIRHAAISLALLTLCLSRRMMPCLPIRSASICLRTRCRRSP